MMGSMVTAIALVHWEKGIWAAKGGAEFPLTILSVALAGALTGPGIYSLDTILKIDLPYITTLRIGGFALVILSVLITVVMNKSRPQPAKETAKS